MWLRRIIGLAEEEAAELVDSVVDDVHVVLALSRPEAGSEPVLEAVGLDARRLRDFVLYVCGINEARAAEREGRAYRRTGKNRRQLDRPQRVAPGAARIIEEAQAEAEANDAPIVGAEHLIAALCRAGGVFVDAGIYRRLHAADPAACEAIAGADVVLVAGGRPEEFLDAVMATPAHEALVDASDAGAIVMGSSAGAAVMGEAAVSDRITDDGFARLDTLGWLAGVIVHTHWVGRTDDDERVADLFRSVLPGLDTLVIAQRAAVWTEPGWEQFRVIDRGDRTLGAHRVHGADGTIEPLPDA